MQDLWDELYGRRRRGSFGADQDHEHQDSGPTRHGFSYFVFFGCTCPVCVAGCTKERAKHVKPTEEDAA